MSYNTRNNTRQSGRFNKNFVSAGANYQTFEVPMSQQPQPQPQPQPPPPAPAPLPPLPPHHTQLQQIVDNPIKTEDVDMPEDATGTEGETAGGQKVRPPFFRTKLSGVKKISNKERRRRQNQMLRRLTSPKNALMCINEMLPNEQVTSQFRVQPAPPHGVYRSGAATNFYAELALGGAVYRGHGETKMAARNAAAEQAIRDIVLKKMERVAEAAAAAPAAPAPAPAAPAPATQGEGAGAEEGEGGEEEGEALPMIQLLSFALHKLFAEWEAHGHRVPSLNKRRTQSQAEEEAMEAEAGAGPEGGAAGGAAGGHAACKKPRKLPDNASAMHPGMVLSMMRPFCNYRELSVEGDRPQNMVFTMAVDVEDQTFVGKASNKKEARKCAARAACKALLGVTFDDELRQ